MYVKKSYWIIIIISISLLVLPFIKDMVYIPLEKTVVFSDKLSDYALFKGNMSDMNPTSNFEVYELSSELFTDYAEKQRLILLPQGEKMIAKNNGLPDFPNGTIIVKTFFYKNHIDQGHVRQKILETRLLIRNNSVWNAATYRWNTKQDEAFLCENGESIPITFIDHSGNQRNTTYQIPSKTNCASCHKKNGSLSPLGPKIRNLNIEIVKDSVHINQLEYFKNQDLLESFAQNFSSTPDYSDNNLDIEKRARAYFDINCAHCHNQNGEAYYLEMDLSYDTSFNDTGIPLKYSKIGSRMSIPGELHMPKIGTTINHDEGIELVLNYIKSLDKDKN